jgi:hypothetical protein
MKNGVKFALWFLGFWLCIVGMALMPMLEFRPIYLVEFFVLLFGAVECIMQCLKYNN